MGLNVSALLLLHRDSKLVPYVPTMLRSVRKPIRARKDSLFLKREIGLAAIIIYVFGTTSGEGRRRKKRAAPRRGRLRVLHLPFYVIYIYIILMILLAKTFSRFA